MKNAKIILLLLIGLLLLSGGGGLSVYSNEYIIKYSHGGRNLNNAALNLMILAPDNREIILDLTKNGAHEISPDIISEDEQPYYIPTDFEIIPEENPIMTLYSFQAPIEFSIYASDKYYSAIDDEEITLSPGDILDIQRILWDYANELNDNGLPLFDFYEGEINSAANYNAPAVIVNYVTKKYQAARELKTIE